MTAEEIFGHISSHMVKGLMTHSDFADYYYFLNLCTYGDMHNDHYIKELNHTVTLQANNTVWNSSRVEQFARKKTY